MGHSQADGRSRLEASGVRCLMWHPPELAPRESMVRLVEGSTGMEIHQEPLGPSFKELSPDQIPEDLHLILLRFGFDGLALATRPAPSNWFLSLLAGLFW